MSTAQNALSNFVNSISVDKKTTKTSKHIDNKPFVFKVGGEAGFGVMSAGLTFAKLAVRSGYYTFDYSEYPSLVRGGHNVMSVTVDKEPVHSQYAHTDFLLALNQETIDFHKNELTPTAGVMFDSSNPVGNAQNIDISGLSNDVHKFGIPLSQIIRDNKMSMVMRNTMSLGAVCALLGADLQQLKNIIYDSFGESKPHLVELNYQAVDLGYKYASEHFGTELKHILDVREHPEPQIIVTANESVGLGAIAAGLGFAAIYPMTPTSNILHTLAPYQEQFGYIYKQPEDELSAINMAIGASFAGVRSMVATSGGGFCLMSEAYGLAGLTETGVVIIEGMRGAPATGIPTWTEQGDLRFVLHAHQGDFPRIVLAPGDVQEAFEMTLLAFNLAEKYQTPVVVLIDKYICESHKSIVPFEYDSYKINRGKIISEFQKDFQRYKLSDDGVSTRSTINTGNTWVANSDEHDEHGYSNEEIDNRNAQMQKRMKKLETCASKDMPKPVLYGSEDAQITIVSWGSNKGPILEALKYTNDANYLHLTWVNPFPVEEVTRILGKAKHIINLECNYSAQMGGIIRQQTGVYVIDNFLKYDGRPFYPNEILTKIEEVKKSL